MKLRVLIDNFSRELHLSINYKVEILSLRLNFVNEISFEVFSCPKKWGIIFVNVIQFLKEGEILNKSLFFFSSHNTIFLYVQLQLIFLMSNLQNQCIFSHNENPPINACIKQLPDSLLTLVGKAFLIAMYNFIVVILRLP